MRPETAEVLRIHHLLLSEYGNHAWHPRDPVATLVSTILSQNTNDVNRDRAFDQLEQHFSTWEAVRDAPVREPAATLAAPKEGEDIVADYASLGLSVGKHPLALLRPRLSRLGLLPAAEVQARPHGSRACAAGLVTCRQRPDTASGVIFVTLEDETGCVNVVVWRDLIERQRRELLGARLLAVEGRIERDGEVVHLIARRLTDRSALLGRLLAPSRDFH